MMLLDFIYMKNKVQLYTLLFGKCENKSQTIKAITEHQNLSKNVFEIILMSNKLVLAYQV